MIQTKSQVQVIDNSGGQEAQCIRTLKTKNATIGHTIVVAVQTALTAHKVQKGDVRKAIVVQTKKNVQRPDGGYIKGSQNGIILLNEKGGPIGTRVTGSFSYDIRRRSPSAWEINNRPH